MVIKIQIGDVNYWYGSHQALSRVSVEVPEHSVSVFFGPAGGGKTTLLRLINRLNDRLDNTTMTGTITVDGEDIYAPSVNLPQLRRRAGMVFALPLPLPGTVRQNVLYGPTLAGIHDRARLDEILYTSLSQAALWDEVKDLCIARSLAVEPDILLLDEPTSGLDPISTARVEQSLLELKQHYTIILVPHSVQQGARVADFAAFFLMGELVEAGSGEAIFTRAQDKRTEDYVTGRFG
jgi:phosphate transport system ATP-binding protein